jgi:hypothetical protein
MESIVEQQIPKSKNPVCETVEYAISRFIRFWYSAATDAKQMDPKPEAISRKLRILKLPEKTIKSVLIKKLNKITFGTVEKKAVIFMIDPS